MKFVVTQLARNIKVAIAIINLMNMIMNAHIIAIHKMIVANKTSINTAIEVVVGSDGFVNLNTNH